MVAESSVVEGRYKDAGYYHWLLAVERVHRLHTQVPLLPPAPALRLPLLLLPMPLTPSACVWPCLSVWMQAVEKGLVVSEKERQEALAEFRELSAKADVYYAFQHIHVLRHTH